MTPDRQRTPSLVNAVAAAMRTKTDRKKVNVEAWAATYGAAESEVREEWAIALAKVPPNTDKIVEGK
jgi:hypothetical protein